MGQRAEGARALVASHRPAGVAPPGGARALHVVCAYRTSYNEEHRAVFRDIGESVFAESGSPPLYGFFVLFFQ